MKPFFGRERYRSAGREGADVGGEEKRGTLTHTTVTCFVSASCNADEPPKDSFPRVSNDD
ncbi:hypothetical protein E2C01_060335 [Portunus trituberculatus]|uniref:Uncharacterized protein n=1 Tax=Portunus trituberculatus TaxID=210409 RepID=A0A5B7H8L3_PORTR|nr:hypothetical protein [Portunus trituberculatus]